MFVLSVIFRGCLDSTNTSQCLRLNISATLKLLTLECVEDYNTTFRLNIFKIESWQNRDAALLINTKHNTFIGFPYPVIWLSEALPEDGGSNLLRNIGLRPNDYTA